MKKDGEDIRQVAAENGENYGFHIDWEAEAGNLPLIDEGSE